MVFKIFLVLVCADLTAKRSAVEKKKPSSL